MLNTENELSHMTKNLRQLRTDNFLFNLDVLNTPRLLLPRGVFLCVFKDYASSKYKPSPTDNSLGAVCQISPHL